MPAHLKRAKKRRSPTQVNAWSLPEADRYADEIVRRAMRGAQQRLINHGKVVAVVLSAKEFKRLQSANRTS